MKIRGLSAALLLAISPMLSHAGGYYGGLKVGAMMNDVSGFDNGTNIGLNLGYAFDDYGNGPAIEGEYTTGASNGDLNILGVTGDWDVDTFALYGAYRFGGDLYGKVKLGYLNEHASASVPGASFSGTDNGASAGIGAGWQLSPQTAIEAEYTIIESDVNFLSLGFNYTF